MHTDRRRYWIFSIVLFASLVADQLTKAWARAALKPLLRPIVVIPGYFDLRYSENPGGAFGLFRDFEYTRYMLFVFGLVALTVIFLFLRRIAPERGRIAAELGLLAGGAVGNIIDRMLFNGRVTDFVVWKVGAHEWPTFNVADAALVVGVIALLLDARGDELAGPAAKKANKE